MIDRNARDQVIAAFEDYLDDKITAFEFDDRLHEIDSEDRTVGEVIHAAWFHYDDCKDHKVHLSKPEWDYFQRLLLILRSGAELVPADSKRWSWDHAVAWGAYAAFIGITLVAGWGWHLLAWAIPFGIISILISSYRRHRESRLSQGEIDCTPFESFSQIRLLRRQVPEFEKRAYRTEIGGRKIRSDAEDRFNLASCYCNWILFGPLVLLFQGLPSVVHSSPKLARPE